MSSNAKKVITINTLTTYAERSLEETDKRYVKTEDIGNIGSGGGSNVTIDSSFITDSENPVQSKVIQAALDEKQDVLTAGDGITIDSNTGTISASVSSPQAITTIINSPEVTETTSTGVVTGSDKLVTAGAVADAINSAIISAMANVGSINLEVENELPTEDISTTSIYLVPNQASDGVTDNVYDEFVYVNGNWELIGNTVLDFTGYVQTSEVSTSTPTQGDNSPISSGAVYTALGTKENPLTFSTGLSRTGDTVTIDSTVLTNSSVTDMNSALNNPTNGYVKQIDTIPLTGGTEPTDSIDNIVTEIFKPPVSTETTDPTP